LETEHDRTKVYTSNHFKAKKNASSEDATPNPPFRHLVSFRNKHGCFAARNNQQRVETLFPSWFQQRAAEAKKKLMQG
jgi:hypothetical protein